MSFLFRKINQFFYTRVCYYSVFKI